MARLRPLVVEGLYYVVLRVDDTSTEDADYRMDQVRLGAVVGKSFNVEWIDRLLKTVRQ